MGALEVLVSDILCEAGLKKVDVRTRTALELPGYFRATKKWDLIVVSDGALVLAMEFKSQAGKSIGNNVNNRSEEAVGSAKDIWTAFREGRFGQAPPPFLGYLFLLEDRDNVKTPVVNKEPYFQVDPEFRGETHLKDTAALRRYRGVSYSKRYELLCRRLVLARIIHERFCCNRRPAATTSLWPALRVKMSETVSGGEFTEQGEQGFSK